uniref:Ras-associating domain-containing protein n=1 Tax=Globodera pallida TaxID=36090 RepID=A0A183BQ99_GLOPA
MKVAVDGGVMAAKTATDSKMRRPPASATSCVCSTLDDQQQQQQMTNNNNNRTMATLNSKRSNVPPRLDLGKRVEDDGTQALRQLRQNCGLLSGPKSPTAQPETLSMAAEADLRNDLMRLMIGDEHLLKIKAQYLDERTALNLRRPVSFSELEQYFQNKHGRLLNFYYTTSTRELMVQVHNQQDLDQVIKLHEGTGGTQRRMRLILSQQQELESEVQAFYEHIDGQEMQNMLTKYRLQLFQMREVGVEVVRRANMASTRAGRVQQSLGERTECVQMLHALLAQSTLDTMLSQLEEAEKRIHEIERHALQIELAMAMLDRVVETKRKTDGVSEEEGGGQQRRRVRWDSAETEECIEK